MALSLDQIRETLKGPKKKQIIAKAVKHEERLRFHTESFMEAGDVSRPLTEFLDWVKTLIPKDKYNIFVSLFRFPTPVVQQTGLIYNELERVFDGRNPSYDYKFTDPSYKMDWDTYRSEKLKEPAIWRKKGWDAVKTAINSVIIVDLPKEQQTLYPEPYFYLLGIENVIDYSYSKSHTSLDWIIFRQGDNQIAVIDDTSYRVIRLDKDGALDTVLVENPHELGYCPARFFWTTELIQKYPELKKAPISPQLANLDWLLFFSISKRHLDLYAPYPIYSAYEADCDFRNNETGEYCDGGFLRDESDHYRLLADGTVLPCPVCSEKRIAGAGSFIDIPVPKDREEADLRNPVQITTVDSNSLDYNVKEVNRLITEIFSRVVGLGGDIQEKQSLNEMQIAANFESKSSVLNSMKMNLENARKFVDDTVCKLRYGDRFLDSSINMGTEFYIFSLDILYARYKQAKENGASEAELDAINEQILATEYRNNPVQLERMKILRHLEPYRHYTIDQLTKMGDSEILNKDLLKIKINFNSFVDKFERENMNIVDFGSHLPLREKIKVITDQFRKYGEEN